ncbi:MAG TPA: hypothetical protein VKV16_09070 [Solirubrobacteraceae bacterium]|nr:hypothetical protein [Solirubrobacteraceae bacterium]
MFASFENKSQKQLFAPQLEFSIVESAESTGIDTKVGLKVLKKRVICASLAATSVAVSLAAIGAPSAVAAPKGEFAVFAQCPVSNPEVEGCLVSRTESGEFKIGNTAVPIVKTETLQGGLENVEPIGKRFVAAANGETLTKAPQKVPGGLLDLVKCNEITGNGLIEKGLRALCESVFENGTTGVNATLELAAPASSIGINEPALETGTGVALSLPVKVKLENTLLGNECYIGSNSNPIKLELTSGTSGTLKGKVGEFEDRAEGRILVIKHNTLVDSGFAAPKATGCGPLGLLDGIVDSKLGLPASTSDTAVLNNTIEQANAEFVAESEG